MLSAKDPLHAEASSSRATADGQALEWDDDDALILWMLDLTPSERLSVADGMLDLSQKVASTSANTSSILTLASTILSRSSKIATKTEPSCQS